MSSETSTISRITAQHVLSDPATSFWLRNALTSALPRDPVDALNDVELLKAALEHRLEEEFAKARAQAL